MPRPSVESLERHRSVIERLMLFGQLFGLVASHPDFTDVETAEMIQANQFVLREKYQTFHHPSPMGEAGPKAASHIAANSLRIPGSRRRRSSSLAPPQERTIGTPSSRQTTRTTGGPGQKGRKAARG